MSAPAASSAAVHPTVASRRPIRNRRGSAAAPQSETTRTGTITTDPITATKYQLLSHTRRSRTTNSLTEGDLVVGPDNSGIVTLVERSTRYVLLGRLPGSRDSATVTGVLQQMIAGLPADLMRTITWDQGQEMASHAAFTVATGCRVFFCDPHSPWQRGTNENTNGLIRDFYPKKTNFNEISDADLAETQRLLNIRPRQTLGWRKPCDRLAELITGVALAT